MAGLLTAVVAVALLLPGLLSGVADDAVAVLLSVPAVVERTTTVTVTEAPAANVPRLHVIVVVPEHDPALGVADTRLAVAGSGSVSVTADAANVPALLTVIV